MKYEESFKILDTMDGKRFANPQPCCYRALQKNMNKIVSILTITFLVMGCEQKSQLFDNKDLQTVTIAFAEAEIKIPNTYKHISPDKLKEVFVNSDKPYDVIQASVQKIETVKALPTDFVIYSDTTDFENNIWFQEGEHVPLTKSLSQRYLGMLEQQLQKEWVPQGIKYDRVESKYLSGRDNQIIKIKYKLTHQKFSRYTTQYLISTKTRTMGIVINSLTLSDYESMVIKMKMK